MIPAMNIQNVHNGHQFSINVLILSIILLENPKDIVHLEIQSHSLKRFRFLLST